MALLNINVRIQYIIYCLLDILLFHNTPLNKNERIQNKKIFILIYYLQ